jgi:class 3 adenylate cyclase
MDLTAVVRALDLDTLALAAGGLGSLRALDYAAHYPQRVNRLAVWSTYLRSSDVFPSAMQQGIATLARANWDLCARMLADTGIRRGSEELGLAFAKVYKQSTTGEVVARLIEDNPDFDVSSVLSCISAPTLVLYSTDDAIYPPILSQKVAAAIPDARIVPLSGVSSAAIAIAEIAGDQINAFLNEGLVIDAPAEPPETASPALPSSMSAILFADIADSTALTERIGDTAFREKARELAAALRSIIADHGGRTIEGPTLGDGVLAVFTSARQTIEAALVCARSGDDAGLPLHLGLHAGDVIHESDPDGRSNVYGGAVNIASRISGLSGPGEVLVSDTVRGLARTSAGVSFEDRGEQALKGVGERLRVWAVRKIAD